MERAEGPMSCFWVHSRRATSQHLSHRRLSPLDSNDHKLKTLRGDIELTCVGASHLECRLAVWRLRERQHLCRRHAEHEGDVAVTTRVGVAEPVVVWREIPFTVILFANRISESR